MADLSYIDRDAETKIVGQDSVGNSVNYVSADANGNLFVKDYSDGPVTAGTAASVSSLIGGQYNSSLPTLTTTQQSAIQIDSSGRIIIRPLTSADVVTANQGTAGASPWLENLTQVGGSAIALGQTTMSASLPVTIASNQSALPVSQSGTWTVQPGNTANTTPWLVTDSSDGPVIPGTVAAKSSLAGGQFNTALPTLTTGQQSAIQLDSSGRLIVSPTTQGLLAEDHNYGTVGANTLRTASQIGNATGAADFNAGATGAQTLRVSANQGSPGTAANAWFEKITDGTNVSTVKAASTAAVAADTALVVAISPNNAVAVTQSTSPWITKDQADGPVAPGTAASFSELVGGQYNSTLPTLTNTQQAALQLDSSGRLIVSDAANPVDINPATQTITTRDIASTTTTGANGQNFITGTPTAGSAASFAFSSEETVIVQTTGTWTGTLQLEISMDGGTTWSPRPSHQDGTSYILNAFTANFTAGTNVGGYTNFRVRAIAAMTGTVTVRIVESVNESVIYIGNALKLTDNQGNVTDITANGDLGVADIINTAGQYRAQSVTTTAAEALGAATILANRKSLSITPTNGTVYWGYSNAVTTTTGSPIFKNQTISFAIGANLHIYLIAGATTDCRIAEGA